MRLVPEEEVLHLKEKNLQFYEPNIRAAARVDDQIQSLLKADEMSVEERLRLIQAKQAELNALLAESRRVFAMKEDRAKLSPPQTAIAPTGEPPSAYEHALLVVPRKARERARKVLDILRASKHVDFDDQFHLLLGGKILPNSNIADLTRALYVNKCDAQHLTEFAFALANVNVPLNLIGNKTVRALMAKAFHPVPNPQCVKRKVQDFPQRNSAKIPKVEFFSPRKDVVKQEVLPANSTSFFEFAKHLSRPISALRNVALSQNGKGALAASAQSFLKSRSQSSFLYPRRTKK